MAMTVRRLLLGCSASQVVLLAAPSRGRTQALPGDAVETLRSLPVEPAAGAGAAALLGVLRGLDAGPAAPRAGRPALRVTLDDGLARSFVVTPPRGVQGLRELRATAAARFAALYGESAESWRLAADWQAAAPFVACALPRELLAVLDDVASRQRWRLESVQPALVRVWNQLRRKLPADGWLLVGFGKTLTVVHFHQERLADLRTLQLAGTPTRDELETLLEQERLRTPRTAAAPPRHALLWAGAADGLPAATTVAGVASRLLRLPLAGAPAGEQASACPLALLGAG
jgi:hypothetical protein